MTTGRTVADKHKAVDRARRAQGLLDDPGLWEAMEDHFVEKLKQIAPDEPGHAAAWYGLQSLESLKVVLRRIINEGEHAKATLERS